MDWQPNQESLRTLAACLKDSLAGFDKAVQKQAEIVSRNGAPITYDSGAGRHCCWWW